MVVIDIQNAHSLRTSIPQPLCGDGCVIQKTVAPCVIRTGMVPRRSAECKGRPIALFNQLRCCKRDITGGNNGFISGLRDCHAIKTVAAKFGHNRI